MIYDERIMFIITLHIHVIKTKASECFAGALFLYSLTGENE